MSDYPGPKAICAECWHPFWFSRTECRCCDIKHEDRAIRRWGRWILYRDLLGRLRVTSRFSNEPGRFQP